MGEKLQAAGHGKRPESSRQQGEMNLRLQSPPRGGNAGHRATAWSPRERKKKLKSDVSFTHLPNKRDMCKDVSHGVERAPGIQDPGMMGPQRRGVQRDRDLVAPFCSEVSKSWALRKAVQSTHESEEPMWRAARPLGRGSWPHRQRPRTWRGKAVTNAHKLLQQDHDSQTESSSRRGRQRGKRGVDDMSLTSCMLRDASMDPVFGHFQRPRARHCYRRCSDAVFGPISVLFVLAVVCHHSPLTS